MNTFIKRNNSTDMDTSPDPPDEDTHETSNELPSDMDTSPDDTPQFIFTKRM